MTGVVANSAEKTEVLYGVDNVIDTTFQIVSRTKIGMDICADSRWPSVAIPVDAYKQLLYELKNKGARIRVVTEITKDNLSSCKELMKFAEVRHLDAIKGNFAVSESEYMATAFFSFCLQEAQPRAQIIYSNVKEIVLQEQYVFETFWNRAIPAELKIREIEEGTAVYQTRILQNRDEIFKQIIHLAETSGGLSIVSTFGGMRLIYENFFDLYKKVLDNYRAGKGKGIQWVGTIDKESVDLAKIFLDLGMEVRHVKNMPPMNFALGERELNATIEKMEGGKMVESLLTSNEPMYVAHFRSIFEELWRNGIDARERINAIEQGVDTGGIEIIQNPVETQKIGWKLLKSAKDEILIMLSTTNAFIRQERIGTLELLKEAVERGVKIRILMPIDDKIKERAQKLKERQIDIRYINEPLQSKVTVLVVDRTSSLAAETKDDTKDTSYEAIGLSTYSNSKPTVLSYASIFESLWIQTELYEQLKAHDAMQKEFINVAAHELRTPIQPILSSTELLDLKLMHAEQRELLDIVSRNAKRLHRLVENILDVTKIESQSLLLKKELFNLNDVILSVVLDYENQIRKENMKIAYDSKEDIFVEADRYRLTQVISNLLSNAIKFTKEGVISIVVRKENEGGDLQIIVVSVKDTGQGIDPEILPRLFTKFTTRSEKGTGLGLFISKSIVESHGGKIRGANNTDGKGATFTFTLPISNSESV